jgi:hypothetical protein
VQIHNIIDIIYQQQHTHKVDDMSQSDNHKPRDNKKLKKQYFNKQEIRKKMKALQGKVNSAFIDGDIEIAISIMNHVLLLQQQLDENSED